MHGRECAETMSPGRPHGEGYAVDDPMDATHEEPSDASSDIDCAFIHGGTGKWRAFGCQSRGNFICEWRGYQGSSMLRGLWFTPSDGSNQPRLSYRAGGNTVVANGTTPFPTGTPTHVALVLDPAGAGQIALYIGGQLVDSAATSTPLSNLWDGNNWIGRSQESANPLLDGSILELRIHDRVLSAGELDASYLAGPDAAFLE